MDRTAQLLDVGPARLDVEPYGAGEPLLLLAGTSCSVDWWRPELCEALAAHGLLVIRYDQRHTGRSTSDPPGQPSYGLPDLVSDAVRLLDALDVGGAHWVGFSQSGCVAQLAALDHPDRVRSLTLVSSRATGHGPAVPDLPEVSEALLAAWNEEGEEPSSGDPAAVVEMLVEGERTLAGTELDEEHARAIARSCVERSLQVRSAVTNHPMADQGPRWRERLGEIAAPCLVLHGTADPLFPLGNGEALAREIPGARLERLPGVGHELPPRVWEAVSSLSRRLPAGSRASGAIRRSAVVRSTSPGLVDVDDRHPDARERDTSPIGDGSRGGPNPADRLDRAYPVLHAERDVRAEAVTSQIHPDERVGGVAHADQARSGIERRGEPRPGTEQSRHPRDGSERDVELRGEGFCKRARRHRSSSIVWVRCRRSVTVMSTPDTFSVVCAARRRATSARSRAIRSGMEVPYGTLTSSRTRTGSPGTVTSPSKQQRPTRTPGTSFSAARSAPRSAPSVIPASTSAPSTTTGMRRPARASIAIPARMLCTQLSSTSGSAAVSAATSAGVSSRRRVSASSAIRQPAEASIEGFTGVRPASR